MLKPKSPQELAIMRQGGKILNNILKNLKNISQIGVSLNYINEQCGILLKQANAKSCSLNYDGFPGHLCLSKNEEVVHGLPRNYLIKDGDLLSYDLAMKYKGLITDSSISFVAGKSSAIQEKIIRVCKECLNLGIKQARVGKRIGDIGYAIQTHAEKNGFSVVRDLVGHGVGYSMHEDIIVPNYGQKGTLEKLKLGMTLAIEPMICEGDYEVCLQDNNQTYETLDKKLACHFEHTVAIGKKQGEILT